MSPALALAPAPACVTAVWDDYSATAALRAECAAPADCTFQAPIGNASARVLIGVIADRAEACFLAAGLTAAAEERDGIGIVRRFTAADGTRCVLLISLPHGTLPDGVRAACR